MAERELLKKGEVVNVLKTVINGVIGDLAIHDGEVTYKVVYEEDGEVHERFFARKQLKPIEPVAEKE